MRPKKSLGQNFLVDPNLRRKISDAVEIPSGAPVLEIGPGRGALTPHLLERVLERGGSLILVELDDALAADLRETYGDRPGVRVVQGDFLELDAGGLVADPRELVVVGNIPYNVTSPILFKLLERPRPREIVLMVQKEVAARIVADPGTSEYGALAVGVRSVAAPTVLFHVGRQAFRPVPGVDSTVLRIRPFDPPPLDPGQEKRLRSLTRATFQWRRKQLGTTLRKHPDYHLDPEDLEALTDATGFDLRRRVETFSPAELVALSEALVSPEP